MRLGSLGAELDAITKEFDYGIVPGSATVFVKDQVNGIGRLDLTLLEGVMIVLEVTDQGYKITSCSPLCNVDPALSTAHTVQTHLETPFESMESLLMTVSPMFRDRFQRELYSKLESVQQHQHPHQQHQQTMLHMDQSSLHIPNQTHTFTSTLAPVNSNSVDNNPTTLDAFDELNNWIN